MFSVAAHAPRVIIHGPEVGSVYGGGTALALHASAYDSEDGSLSDSAIVWNSDIDGQLAASGIRGAGDSRLVRRYPCPYRHSHRQRRDDSNRVGYGGGPT